MRAFEKYSLGDGALLKFECSPKSLRQFSIGIYNFLYIISYIETL